MLVLAIRFLVRKTQVQCNFYETQTRADIIFILLCSVIYVHPTCIYLQVFLLRLSFLRCKGAVFNNKIICGINLDPVLHHFQSSSTS